MARNRYESRGSELVERERIMAWVAQRQLAFLREAATKFHLKLLGPPDTELSAARPRSEQEIAEIVGRIGAAMDR